MSLSWTTSSFWLLPSIALAALAAACLYAWWDKGSIQLSKSVRFMLAGLRFSAYFLLFLLLLNPVLRHAEYLTLRPVVALVADNSLSIQHSNAGKDTTAMREALAVLRSKLSERFEISNWLAGNKLRKAERPDFSDASTNLAEAISGLSGRKAPERLAAVVLLSDGLYNDGSNPVFEAAQADHPWFTLSLGDSSRKRDAVLEQVQANALCYKGDRIQLIASILAEDLQGEPMNIKWEQISSKGNELLSSKIIPVTARQFKISVSEFAEAREAGLMHLRLTVMPMKGEWSLRNNSRDIFIEVLDNRQKILLAGHSPHPDLSALKSALDINKNYAVEVSISQELEQKNPADYSMIVLHQLPAGREYPAVFMGRLSATSRPCWYILGSQSPSSSGRGTSTCSSYNLNWEQFNFAQAGLNPEFALFRLPEGAAALMASCPPLACGFGKYDQTAKSEVLLWQKVNQVLTDYPLLSFCSSGSSRQALLMGEGLWKWRMQDVRSSGNQNTFNGIIQAVVQYLASKDDPRPFRLRPVSPLITEGMELTFSAELYNASRQAVTSPEIEMVLTDSSGRERKFRFAKGADSYALNTGALPSGSYRYTAKTRLGDQNYSAFGEVQIKPSQLEFGRSRADFDLLQELSGRTAALSFPVQEAAKLADSILSRISQKPFMEEQITVSGLIDESWLMLAVALLLTAEWFVRKWFGIL